MIMLLSTVILYSRPIITIIADTRCVPDKSNRPANALWACGISHSCVYFLDTSLNGNYWNWQNRIENIRFRCLIHNMPGTRYGKHYRPEFHIYYVRVVILTLVRFRFGHALWPT